MRETAIRADLREKQAGTAAVPSVSHVFRQLCVHGLIEPLPEQSAVYEPTARVKGLLREFQREQALTTPKVIRGHLEQIDTDRKRLIQCGERNSQSGALRALERLNNELEQIRSLSRTNREALLHRVTALRATKAGPSVRERFDTVVEMMDDHIYPLEQIVRTNGPAETQFAQLEDALGHVRPAFANTPAVRRELDSTGARLRRVRRDVLRNFETARDEVLPLFNERKRDSMLVRGASQLLHTVHHEGPDALQLPERIRLRRFNLRTVLDDDTMRSFLLDMRAYTPAPPAPISRPSGDDTPTTGPNRNHLLVRTQHACPLDDVMAWLVEQYAEAPTRHLLAAYRYVLQAPGLTVSFQGPPRTYAHGSYVLTATPARARANAPHAASPSSASS